jgi:hypothetical protein
MIVESTSYSSSLSNTSSLTPLKLNRFNTAMSKLTLKQNGHTKINENSTDDDYGGGGHHTSISPSMYVVFID